MTRCASSLCCEQELWLTDSRLRTSRQRLPLRILSTRGVGHELLALQLLVLLRPKDDYIEIAVSFTCEVGAFLAEHSLKASATVFECFRTVLNEDEIGHRL